MSQNNTREPIEMAVGDTLAFTRELPNYLPSDGWSLLYEIRGQGQAQEFTSTTSGTAHEILVTAAVTATWTAGTCVVSGFAENTDGRRQQIYAGALEILSNVPETAATMNVKTFAQTMVEDLQVVLESRASGALSESQLGETRFKFKTDEELQKAHAYWSEMRRSEIGKQRGKAGLPTGYKIKSVFKVVNQGQGPLYGQQWPIPQ